MTTFDRRYRAYLNHLLTILITEIHALTDDPAANPQRSAATILKASRSLDRLIDAGMSTPYITHVNGALAPRYQRLTTTTTGDDAFTAPDPVIRIHIRRSATTPNWLWWCCNYAHPTVGGNADSHAAAVAAAVAHLHAAHDSAATTLTIHPTAPKEM